MMNLGSTSYSESSTANQSSKHKQKQLGAWLSLSPPRGHTCPHYSRTFCSIKAVGGHQNAHRDNTMHNMHMEILAEEERKKRIVHEAMCIHNQISPVSAIEPQQTKMASNTAVLAPMANYPPQIDLDLHLSCGPCNKVMNFYDFMPMNQGSKGYGVGVPSGSGVNKTYAETSIPFPYNPATFTELAQVFPMRDGANVGGFGGGSGGFLEAFVGCDEPPLADPYVEWLPRRRGTNKVNSSNTGVDVTLKL